MPSEMLINRVGRRVEALLHARAKRSRTHHATSGASARIPVRAEVSIGALAPLVAWCVRERFARAE